MAKDLTDYRTVDFIPPVLNVACGQVLRDRQRHIAIFVKKGRTRAYLVLVKSGTLKLSKFSAKHIVDNWMDAEYPFDQAVAKLTEMGRKNGITEAAKVAMEDLLRGGKEPSQVKLFE